MCPLVLSCREDTILLQSSLGGVKGREGDTYDNILYEIIKQIKMRNELLIISMMMQQV